MENNHTANSQSGGKVLAMYDIRGIQDYIYRTPHIKDAMGASLIIEDILMKALRKACEKLSIKPEEMDLEWEKGEEEEEVKPFKMSEPYRFCISAVEMRMLYTMEMIYIEILTK